MDGKFDVLVGTPEDVKKQMNDLAVGHYFKVLSTCYLVKGQMATTIYIKPEIKKTTQPAETLGK